jgi:hypothetical protein
MQRVNEICHFYVIKIWAIMRNINVFWKIIFLIYIQKLSSSIWRNQFEISGKCGLTFPGDEEWSQQKQKQHLDGRGS